MQCIRDTARPTLLCKMMLKSVSDCYFAEEAYRSLSMSLAVGKSPNAISTHVMSPDCPSYLFPRSKGYWCSGGSEAVKQRRSKISISNAKSCLKRSNPSSKHCASGELKRDILQLASVCHLFGQKIKQ